MLLTSALNAAGEVTQGCSLEQDCAHRSRCSSCLSGRPGRCKGALNVLLSNESDDSRFMNPVRGPSQEQQNCVVTSFASRWAMKARSLVSNCREVTVIVEYVLHGLRSNPLRCNDTNCDSLVRQPPWTGCPVAPTDGSRFMGGTFRRSRHDKMPADCDAVRIPSHYSPIA